MHLYWGDACVNDIYLIVCVYRQSVPLKTSEGYQAGRWCQSLASTLGPLTHLLPSCRLPSLPAWLTRQELSFKDSPRSQGQALVPQPRECSCGDVIIPF